MPPKASTETTAAPTINRKKQKRREKQAARLAEEQNAASNLTALARQPPPNGGPQYSIAQLPISENVRQYTNGFGQGSPNYEDYPPQESDDQYYTEDDHPLLDRHYQFTNGYTVNPAIATNGDGSKSQRKKRGKSNPPPLQATPGNSLPQSHQQTFAPSPPAPPSNHNPGISKERIWNTSTGEERERIKEFWLSLGEEDRRALVKIEKEAVLRKMKEQQRTSCNCTVCGRKRVAIEEELEVLYDAYYEELESYANHQQVTSEDGTPIMPPTRGYASTIARGGPWNRKTHLDRRVQEVFDGEVEDDEEEYSDEDEEDYSDDEHLNENYSPANDFFNFGNSLTVQGGILTVADDLLKNDGKRFIDMMEQLAERRMHREEQAAYSAAMGQSSIPNHTHAPSMDQEQYAEDEDDYDSAEDEEEEFDDEMEQLTEDQRMEEGRRMFQIFAARMFEQRVLTAYKEKVAQERQQKLIEELDEESRLDKTREAKKAKEAQKKKEKKRLQKQAKDEERQRKEAEKAAEEAARKTAEEKKLEEQRQRKEEQRRKKEAEKKAQDEERQRKEAEKHRKLHEAREQQAEQERKQREQREREKKKKDELRKKEREEKEAREREVSEREANEKVEQQAEEQRQRDVKSKAEQEFQEKKAKDEQIAKRMSRTASTNQPALKTQASATNLHPPAKSSASNRSSPHLPVAVPVMPKAPTPVRPTQNNFQNVQASPGTSTTASNAPAASPQSGTSPPMNTVKPLSIDTQTQARLPQTHYSTPFSPGAFVPGHPPQPPGLVGPSPIFTGFGSTIPPIPPPGMQRMHNQQSPYNTQHAFGRNMYQNHGPPGPIGSTPIAPSAARAGSLPTSQAPVQAPIGSLPNAGSNAGMNFSQQRENIPTHPRFPRHSRQFSASNDHPQLNQFPIAAGTQPIARPAPIQRPSSVAPSQHKENASIKKDVDDLSIHLGSSALLDDSDVPLAKTTQSRRNSMAPGEARRPTFNSHPFNPNSNAQTTQPNHIWGPPPTTPSSSTLSTPLSAIFGADGRPLSSQGLPQILCDSARKIVCGVCQTANGLKLAQNIPHDGWHDLMRIYEGFYQQWPQNMPPIDGRQFLQLCEMEGNEKNGGGKFELVYDGRSKDLHFSLSEVIIKYEPIPPGWGRAPGGDVRPTANTEIHSPRLGNTPPGLSNVRGVR